ncbi:MAG: type IV toxin-antitoxin system AbiEi family antitoxin domain-containing protein [Solirubrobacterales bacterium]
MATTIGTSRPGGAWKLAKRQHGVVSRQQLLDLGLTHAAIRDRLAIGRLHRARHGVYAVGRAELTQHGRWMAVVLACGKGAVLSHRSAGALWGLIPRCSVLEVTVPAPRHPKRPGIRVHKSNRLDQPDLGRRHGIPVTSPVRTLIDLAVRFAEHHLEAAVIAADNLDLVDPERLRAALAEGPGQPGVPALRRLLDSRTFAITDSGLERRFMRISDRAGLPKPETGAWLEGFQADFFWRGLGLIVETDSLRYHRTASQQARDRRRDQAHASAGLTTLRFTHSQVVHEPDHVVRTLVAVAARLASGDRTRSP